MESPINLNNVGNQAPEPSKIDIPSSLSSVSIRTLESDVESLRQTGGARPVPQIVDASGVGSVPQAPAQVADMESPVPAAIASEAPATLPEPAPGSGIKWGWLFWIVGIAILFLIGYFILPLVF